jgi:tetratricopeptide (TPR) repeat protein
MHLFVRTFKWNIILAFAICWFVAAAHAQTCGPSHLAGFVTDEAGKAVPGAKIEVLEVKTKGPIKQSEKNDNDTATDTATDGSYSLRGWYAYVFDGIIVRVTAPGFISHEETIHFSHCNRCLHVKLARAEQPSDGSRTKGKHTEESSPPAQKIGQSAASPVTAGDLTRKVEEALSLGSNSSELQDAECGYQLALTLNPSEPRAHLGLGKIYYQQKRYADALEACLRATRLDPNLANAYFWLGTTYYAMGRYAEAIEALNQATRLKPDYIDAYKNLGLAYHLMGKDEKAVETIKHAISLQPDDAAAYHTLAFIYATVGRHAEAVEALNKEIFLQPFDPAGYGLLGWTYLQMGKYEESVEALKKAIHLPPQEASAYNTLGAAYEQMKKYAEAVEAYTQAVRLNPDFLAYANLARANMSWQHYSEAVDADKQAIRLQPGNAYTYNALGWTYSQLGKNEESVEALKQAIRLKPDFAEAFSNLGDSYVRIAHDAEAIEAYKRAVQLDPKLDSAYLSLGNVYNRIGRYDDTITMYNQLLERAPTNAGMSFSRGWAYLYLGRSDAAAADAQAYLKSLGWKDSQSPYAALLAYVGYRQARREGEARKLLDEAATNLDPSGWAYKIFRYLRREVSAQELLTLATDNDKMTEVKAYIGTDLLIAGRRDEAVVYLRWVKENGNKAFVEYLLAISELDKLK